MDIGRFDKLVTFKVNTPAATGAGSTDSYSTLLQAWGSLKKSNSSRGLSYGESAFDNTYTLIVYYQDSIYNAIRTDLKVDIDSVTYTVTGWEKLQEKRFYLKFNLNRQDG